MSRVDEMVRVFCDAAGMAEPDGRGNLPDGKRMSVSIDEPEKIARGLRAVFDGPLRIMPTASEIIAEARRVGHESFASLVPSLRADTITDADIRSLRESSLKSQEYMIVMLCDQALTADFGRPPMRPAVLRHLARQWCAAYINDCVEAIDRE